MLQYSLDTKERRKQESKEGKEESKQGRQQENKE